MFTSSSAEHTLVVQQLLPNFISVVRTVSREVILSGTKALGIQFWDLGPAYNHCVIWADGVGPPAGIFVHPGPFLGFL